jgi:hypothetical protein
MHCTGIGLGVEEQSTWVKDACPQMRLLTCTECCLGLLRSGCFPKQNTSGMFTTIQTSLNHVYTSDSTGVNEYSPKTAASSGNFTRAFLLLSSWTLACILQRIDGSHGLGPGTFSNHPVSELASSDLNDNEKAKHCARSFML